MSGFQKKALLKQALKLGLDPVAENPLLPSNVAAVETKFLQQEENEALLVQTVHEKNILLTVGTAINTVFPIQETYHDPKSGLVFNTYYAPAGSENAPLFVCHHGAGSSAMSFWSIAKTLRRFGVQEEKPGIFAYTARGHSDNNMSTTEYKLSDFTHDFLFVMEEFISRNKPKSTICLLGHSLGGAVITDYVTRFPQTTFNIMALVVVDIVEETAVQSLLQMAMFLNKRPKSFATYAQAIQWHLQSRMLRNEESARISVPDLLTSVQNRKLVWKASLQAMAPYWDTWFSGLSQKFLNCNFEHTKLTKLLILSTNETLDKALTIGQMQGKFQLIVFNNSINAGHFLHEDIPHQVAIKLMDFMRRYKNSGDNSVRATITPLWGGKINP